MHYNSVLFTLLFATITCNKIIPKSINICPRNDPNVIQCVRNAIEELKPQLKIGIPELNVPAIEPFVSDEIILFQGDHPESPNLALKASIKNVEARGGSNFNLIKYKEDLSRNVYSFGVTFPKLDVNGNFLVGVGPFKQSGKFNIDLFDIECHGLLKGELIKFNGHRQLNFTSLNLVFRVKDYKLVLSDYLKGVEFMQKNVDQILESNKFEFLQIALPFAERKVEEMMLKIANGITDDLDYDEVYPEN